MEITSTLKAPGSPVVVVNFDFGANLEESVAKFGADVVYNKFVDAAVISVQALVRRLIAKGGADGTPEAIQAKVSAWLPTAGGAVRRSPAEKITDTISKMSVEQKQALLKQLRDDIKAAG